MPLYFVGDKIRIGSVFNPYVFVLTQASIFQFRIWSRVISFPSLVREELELFYIRVVFLPKEIRNGRLYSKKDSRAIGDDITSNG